MVSNLQKSEEEEDNLALRCGIIILFLVKNEEHENFMQKNAWKALWLIKVFNLVKIGYDFLIGRFQGLQCRLWLEKEG